MSKLNRFFKTVCRNAIEIANGQGLLNTKAGTSLLASVLVLATVRCWLGARFVPKGFSPSTSQPIEGFQSAG